MNNAQSNDFAYANYNILIVDDTPINLEVIVDFLDDAGFGIRIARSGKSALKRIAYERPDIVLLDVLMPDMDGFETCRRLKASEETCDIPIILMTSLASIEDKVNGFKAGAVDYVTKPLHQEEVLARIKTHLRLRDLTISLEEKNRQMQRSNQIEKMRLFEAVSQQREQLRALTQKLTEIQETERTQLARELHDEMGQSLTAISLNLTAVLDTFPPSASGRERLEEAQGLVSETLEQVRELSLNLRPPMLDDLGLVPTLLWYIKRYTQRTNIDVNFATSGLDKRLSSILETAVYRIIQEALTNIVRHARTATEIHIHLQYEANVLSFQIKDNGVGFDMAQIFGEHMNSNGLGLVGMRERVHLLNGRFHIDSQPNQGMCISITIPWEE